MKKGKDNVFISTLQSNTNSTKKGNIDYVTNPNNIEIVSKDTIRKQYTLRGYNKERIERSRTSMEF